LIELCTEALEPAAARGRILAWLAEGAREVTWALCAVPRERWLAPPPRRLGDWPALRHARHLVLNERHLTLPAVRYMLGDRDAEAWPSATTLEQVDAAWDPTAGADAADDLVRAFAATRFELLQRLEAAPDECWSTPAPAELAVHDLDSSSPTQLDGLLLRARQHELEHLATIWRLALYWDRVPTATPLGVPFHPADRLEESH
jgi:hypothetical protein